MFKEENEKLLNQISLLEAEQKDAFERFEKEKSMLETKLQESYQKLLEETKLKLKFESSKNREVEFAN